MLQVITFNLEIKGETILTPWIWLQLTIVHSNSVLISLESGINISIWETAHLPLP